ncbi:GNAT family N-acetyltransferase [Thalassospira sp.]|uniref:GNAT family N-acetyltransferase n=1 Tax=Thalassospira sp. TaxID=1912094 RepID=UPI0027361E3D|nr:GNAT family N-acetyltransferase [Thalassospira sp.]MDP2697163.1 GNAT family N-acetyltransferase [Thalassospira sp.]
MPSRFDIRPARPGDCAVIAAMSNAIHAEHDYPGIPHSEDSIRDMMFGDRPILESLLVQDGNGNDAPVIGQALFQEFYNPDLSARGLWLTELYVMPAYRSAKIGGKLMTALAAEALRRNAVSIWWTVLADNIKACRFYQRLGAIDAGAVLYEIDGDALRNLAQQP